MPRNFEINKINGKCPDILICIKEQGDGGRQPESMHTSVQLTRISQEVSGKVGTCGLDPRLWNAEIHLCACNPAGGDMYAPRPSSRMVAGVGLCDVRSLLRASPDLAAAAPRAFGEVSDGSQ